MAGDILTGYTAAPEMRPSEPQAKPGGPADNWAVPHSNASPAAAPASDPLLRVTSAVSSQLPIKTIIGG